jgi:predicted alpha-1,6-mannanase (GH76 family)
MQLSRREFLIGAAALSVPAETPSGRARRAWDALNHAYWNAGRRYFRTDPEHDEPIHFWLTAQLWECVMDAWQLFRDSSLRKQIDDVYDAFVLRNQHWEENTFNDDIMWWVGACCRAYRLTGGQRFLAKAQKEFDRLSATEQDGEIGGGFWWKSDKHESKHACVNGPAAIAALELAAALKEKRYLEQAKAIYGWERGALFDATTGRVFDFIRRDGKVGHPLYTYNGGTFIGTAVRLARQTGDSGYLRDARLAADCLRRELSPSGILKSEGQGDGGAFKMIAVRHLAELAALPGCADIRAFLIYNARCVWKNRRTTDDVTGFDWSRPVNPDERIECQSAASGVSLLLRVASLGK